MVLTAAASAQEKRLGIIDFFGQGTSDTASIRHALPFHEGDIFPTDPTGANDWKQRASAAVMEVTGRPATDVAAVCCTGEGEGIVFIGVSDNPASLPAYHSVPTGDSRLPPELMSLNAEVDEAWIAAVMKGETEEDRSRGYSLLTEPAARSLQLQFRDVALQHEQQIFDVLATSSDAEQRAVAATALGYCRQTDTQIDALVSAASDPDSEVRNNAVRALGVLVEAKPELRAKIPPGVFIDLVRSGTWTDRNKGSFLLMSLTGDRDEDLMAALRSEAVEALTEMAGWRSWGHAYPAWMVLGRIAGMEDRRIEELIDAGRIDDILAEVSQVH